MRWVIAISLLLAAMICFLVVAYDAGKRAGLAEEKPCVVLDGASGPGYTK